MSALPELERLRASIDNMDAILLHTLAERFKLTQQVGVLRAQHDLPPSDKAREARQIERLQRLAPDTCAGRCAWKPLSPSCRL